MQRLSTNTLTAPTVPGLRPTSITMAYTKHYNHLGKRCAPPFQSEPDSVPLHKAQKQEPKEDTEFPNSEIQMIPSQQLKRRNRRQKYASLKRQNAVDLEEGDERSVGQLARATEEGDDEQADHTAGAQAREVEKSGNFVHPVRPVHPGLVDGDGLDGMEVDGNAPAIAAKTESASPNPYHTSYGGNDDDERDLHILNWAINVPLPQDEDESLEGAATDDLASTDSYNETTSSDDEQMIDPGAFATIPLKYLDPLSGSLMIDPVILPTSGRTVERESTEESLLEDPVDPWTKAPLKIEDMIPNATLKAQIQVFKAKRTATPIRPNQRMLLALAAYAKQGKKEREDVEIGEASISAASHKKGVYQDGDHVFAQQHVLHYDGSDASSHAKTGSCEEASDCGCHVCRIASHLKEVRRSDRSKLLEAQRAANATNAANAANANVNAISRETSERTPSTRSYNDNDHHSEPQPSLHYDGSKASSHVKASSCKEKLDCVCRTCHISGPSKKVRDDRSKPLEVKYSGINETVNETIIRLRPNLVQQKPQSRAQQPTPADTSAHNDSSLADASGNEGSFFSDESYPDEDNAAHGSQNGSGGQEAADAAAPPGGDGSSSGSSNRSPSQKSSSSSSSEQSSSEDESNRGENRCNQWNGSHESSCGEPVCYNCHPEYAYESVPASSEPPSLVQDDAPSDKDSSPSEVHTESVAASSESAQESFSEYENEQSIADDESSSSEDPTSSEIYAARHNGSDGSCGRSDCDDCHPGNVFGRPAPSSSSSSGLGEELTHVDRDYAPQQVGRLDYGDEDQTVEDAGAAAEAGVGENGDGDASEHSSDEGEEAADEGGETQQPAPLAPGQGYVEVSRAEQQQAELYFAVSDGKVYGDEE
jgi:hypothetical protein